jgi:hypothetical protein
MNNNYMLKLFIVFHEKIFDKCYENIPQDILDKYFTFIAVNKKIPKNYTEGKYNVVNEWELPHYNSQFQDKGYKENSAIYHVYANKLYGDAKYVGFFQYDMYFEKNVIDTILTKAEKEPTCFYVLDEDIHHTINKTWDEPYVLDYLISLYSYNFNTPINYKTIGPRLNTYVLPVQSFLKIMKFVSVLYSRLGALCFKKHFNHIAVLYEIVMAFCISQELLRMTKLDIKHDHDYKSRVVSGEDTLSGYKNTYKVN